MKRILSILFSLCGLCFGQTHVGSISNIWPSYATTNQLNDLRLEFDTLVDTNGITGEYADTHYLAIAYLTNVTNAERYATNAYPQASWDLVAPTIIYSNTATYTDAVAKASAAYPQASWDLVSPTIIYSNTAAYTDAVAKASAWASASNSVVYTNNAKLLASITNEADWIAASNTVVYTNNAKLLAAITNEADWIAASNSVVYSNNARFLAAITNGETNVTIEVATATATNAPPTYGQLLSFVNIIQRQLNSIANGAYETYLTSKKLVVSGITPTNSTYEDCSTQEPVATNFVYTYTGAGAYGFASVCTNRVFTNIVQGTATYVDFSWEGGAGAITDKVELYAYVIGTTNEVELGQDAIPQTVPSSAGQARLFAIPFSSYSNTNGFYLGSKKKCVTKGSGSDVTQLVGDGYNTHCEWDFLLLD